MLILNIVYIFIAMDMGVGQGTKEISKLQWMAMLASVSIWSYWYQSEKEGMGYNYM